MHKTISAILILSGIFGGLAGCDQEEESGKDKKVALHIPKEPPKRPYGTKALTVKVGPEPFSKEDVANYFKTHNLPMNFTSTSDFALENLEFMTNKEVTTRLNGASPGLADNDRVGLATLIGSFIFTGPSSGKSVVFRRAYAVFNAMNGNLMMIGTLEQGEQLK
jgi:hypothetical protein